VLFLLSAIVFALRLRPRRRAREAAAAHLRETGSHPADTGGHVRDTGAQERVP
jgi:hypothetical protein